MLSDGTRRALRLHQSEEIKILNISLLQVGIEPTTDAFTVTRLCPCGTTSFNIKFELINIIIYY